LEYWNRRTDGKNGRMVFLPNDRVRKQVNNHCYPAIAVIQGLIRPAELWIPAFAGRTRGFQIETDGSMKEQGASLVFRGYPITPILHHSIISSFGC
jgi:hypothetical protein